MNIKVNELMTASVVTAAPHQSIEHVRKMFDNNRIGAMPVVDSDNHPVGMISTTDLAKDLKPGAPISTVMTQNAYSVPQYDDVSTAARVMRNHKIHHVVVTHEQKVVGILGAFDLLKLIEGHRYVAKNPPTKSTRRASKRA